MKDELRYLIIGSNLTFFPEGGNGCIIGTDNKFIEGFIVRVTGKEDLIKYENKIDDKWSGEKSKGELSGAAGNGKPFEAIKIRLEGSLYKIYDIFYRTFVEKYGWLDWTKNGERSGADMNLGIKIRKIQIYLKIKGEIPSEEPAQNIKGFSYLTKVNPLVAGPRNHPEPDINYVCLKCIHNYYAPDFELSDIGFCYFCANKCYFCTGDRCTCYEKYYHEKDCDLEMERPACRCTGKRKFEKKKCQCSTCPDKGVEQVTEGQEALALYKNKKPIFKKVEKDIFEGKEFIVKVSKTSFYGEHNSDEGNNWNIEGGKLSSIKDGQQKFKFIEVGEGYYNIISVETGMYLTSSETRDDAAVILEGKLEGREEDQKFLIYYDDYRQNPQNYIGSFCIEAKSGDHPRCIGKIKNWENNLALMNKNGKENQRWNLLAC